MSSKVTIYTLSHCPYCVSAKSLLKENDVPFTEILVHDEDVEMRDRLVQKSGLRTFPQIFTDDVLLGGFKELNVIYHQRGLKHLTNQGV